MAFGKLEGLFTYLYLLDDHTRIVLLFSRTSYLGAIRSGGYCVVVIFSSSCVYVYCALLFTFVSGDRVRLDSFTAEGERDALTTSHLEHWKATLIPRFLEKTSHSNWKGERTEELRL